MLSFLAAAVVVALTVLNFTILRDRNTVFQSVLTCIVGLLIPLMGWIGAKNSNRSMVGMFCASSFTCGLFNLISYCVVMASIAAVRVIIEDCSPNDTVIIDGEVNTTICKDYTDDMLVNMYIIATCVTIPVVILQCTGSYYGNKLLSKLTPGVIITYEIDPYPYGGQPIITVPPPTYTVPANAVTVQAHPV